MKDIFEGSDFNVFKEVLESGGSIFGLNAKGLSNISRKDIDNLTAFAQESGAKGLAWKRCSLTFMTYTATHRACTALGVRWRGN